MKKIPLCALCGESLKKFELRILLEWTKVRPHKMVGWHGICADKDPLYAAHLMGEPPEPDNLIKGIEERGQGRIS